MATVTYIGRANRTAYAGFTFYRNQPRPLPDGVAEDLADHPWFTVEIEKRRGRKPKDENPS